MYPDGEGGGYASHIPFISDCVSHSVQLDNPDEPAEYTWLHTAPRIPEGTTTLHLQVHLHPDLPPGLSSRGALQYPSTLKFISVDLMPLADANGEARATVGSFLAVFNIWSKIFARFRPGIKYFIHNIHRWDDLNYPPREAILNMFCLARMGAAALTLDRDGVWNTCRPHVTFVRGQPFMHGGAFEAVHLNPDGTPMVNPDGTPSTFMME